MDGAASEEEAAALALEEAAEPAQGEAPLDDREVDLRAPQWTHEQLVAASSRTLQGRELQSFLLHPDDALPASAKPKRKADGGEARPKSGGGRLLLEAVAGEARRGDTDASRAFLAQLVAFLGAAAEGARVPLFLGRDIELHRLFTAVAAFGGAAGVAACKRAWSAVSDLVHGAVRAPTKAAVHRGAYEALLAGYEAHLVASGEYAAVVEAAREAFPEAAAELALRAPDPGAAAAKRQKRQGRPERESRSCKACGEPGDGRLVPCDFCPSAFHLACVDLDAFPQTKWWKCAVCVLVDPNDDWCVLCGDEGDLLCCDACPRSFHVVCLALPEVPPEEQKWLCPVCCGDDPDAMPLEVTTQRPARALRAASGPASDAATALGYEPGTIKHAAITLLQSAGGAGITVNAVMESGLYEIGACKTPANSIISALSQDGNFKRVAPCTYALSDVLRPIGQAALREARKAAAATAAAGEGSAAAALASLVAAPVDGPAVEDAAMQ